MITINYKKFNLTLSVYPITLNNFHNCDITITDSLNHIIGYIYRRELSFPDAIALTSNNEEKATDAIRNILGNRKREIKRIENSII